MKSILKTTTWLLVILFVVAIGMVATGNQFLLKGLWAAYLHGNTSATIGDARFFSSRTIGVGVGDPWSVSNEEWPALSVSLKESLEDTRSVAFLVVKGDTIIYEEYWDGYDQTSRSNSFSMAKSITTMLAQCAIQDGYISGWDEKVVHWLPDLQGAFAKDVTLRHLSTMTAGLDFNEHYTNPFDITAKLYYGPDAAQLLIDEVPVTKRPGQFEYQSGATQLLGLAVMKATGLPLAEYASQKLWKPLGAMYSGEWHLDREDGNELAFCCFNSNARDFARFGQLMLQLGNWNGKQLLDTAFVEMATSPFTVPYYGHGFWIDDSYGTSIFYQRGILGQYIIVIPEHELVIVRLGHERRANERHHPSDFRVIVEEVLEMVRV